MDVSGFIDELGGTTKAATIFGVLPSAVSNWRAWNKLPARLHLKAVRVAAERKIAFDPEAPSKQKRRAA